MNKKTTFFHQYVAGILLVAAATTHAQSIDSLRQKQATLEAELDQLKSKIFELESKGGARADAEKKPSWFISQFGISEVNSAGGVEPYLVFFNPNTITPIKYINVRALLFNAVGDVVSSDIGGQTFAGMNFTGPLSNSDGAKRADWGPVWYNTTGECIKLASVVVTFVNGKSMKFDGKNLASALAPELTNDCKMRKR